MDHWEDIGRLRLIDLDELRTNHTAPARPSESSPAPEASLMQMEPERVLKCMLFADIVGFSKLREEELPGLWRFLAQVRLATDAHCSPPDLVESWGDALYVAMNTASELLQYAFVLQRQFAEMDPSRYGLSKPLRLRVGLHAGPVFQGEHPLTGKPIIYGSHVSRTARIEPVTLPGQVYGSQQFVALLTAEESVRRYEADMTGDPYLTWYACDYLGNQQLAKRYGKQPVYHLRAVTPSRSPR
jgi:class 3 adenylate cyclase